MQWEIRSDGIYIRKPGMLHIYHWSFVIAEVLFFLFFLFLLFLLIRTLRRRYAKEIWEKTMAQILENDQVIGIEQGRARNGAVVYPDYKISYKVHGKKYEQLMNGSQLIGCIDVVDIEYLKKKPYICRKARKQEEDTI